MIAPCTTCKDYRSDAAKWQDQKYGHGKRVFNVCGGKQRDKARCTICGNVISKQ
jgi:hypothetical protein